MKSAQNLDMWSEGSMLQECITCEKSKPEFVMNHQGDGYWYCKSCTASRSREYGAKNREKISAKQKVWNEANPGKVLSYLAAYRAKYPERYLALKSVQQKKRSLRVPRWLTHKDWIAIEAVYSKSLLMTKMSGVEHEVDHILPLCGKFVSGLHVPANLQVLTKAENRKKAAK